MPQGNLDRLRKSYEALSQTGEWPDDGFLAADFELHRDAFVDGAKVLTGPGAPGELMREWQGSFRDITVEAQEVLEAPGGELVAIVRFQGHGRASGTAIDKQQAHIWTVTDSRASTVRIYAQPAE